MSASPIRIPAGLTTDGSLRRRYMARFIDSVVFLLVILAFLQAGNVFTLIWLGAHLVVMHRSPVYQAIHDRFAHAWVAAPEETTQLRLA